MSRSSSKLPLAPEQEAHRSSVTPDDEKLVAGRWVLAGCVQGMGARPTVYRLAVECGLAGSVKN